MKQLSLCVAKLKILSCSYQKRKEREREKKISLLLLQRDTLLFKATRLYWELAAKRRWLKWNWLIEKRVNRETIEGFVSDEKRERQKMPLSRLSHRTGPSKELSMSSKESCIKKSHLVIHWMASWWLKGLACFVEWNFCRLSQLNLNYYYWKMDVVFFYFWRKETNANESLPIVCSIIELRK